MKPRATPLPPPPARLPYLSATVGGRTFWARVPSLLTLAQVSKALDRERTVGPVAGLVAGLVAGASIESTFTAIQTGGQGAVELLGCMLGVAWADPVYEMETPRPATWTSDTIARYGAGVFEEIHEAGWQLQHMLQLGLAVLHHLVEASRVEQEVLEQARFFGQPRGTTSAEPSMSNAPSSEAGSALSTS